MALHFDPVAATRELEAHGFEHEQAAAIVNLIRDRVLPHAEAGRDEDADAAVAAITQTEHALRNEIGAVRAELATFKAEARADLQASEARLTHRIEIATRDAAEKAAAQVTGRIGLWLGLATGFLGLMIAASALAPAIIALAKP